MGRSSQPLSSVACAGSLLATNAFCQVLKGAPLPEQLALDALVAELLSKHTSLHAMLSKLDSDHDGVISTEELGAWLAELGAGLEEAQLASVMLAFGPSHSAIQYRDFYKVLKHGLKKSPRHRATHKAACAHNHHHHHHVSGSQTAREPRAADASPAVPDGSQTAREHTSSASPTFLTSAKGPDGLAASTAKPSVGHVTLDWHGADEDESDWEVHKRTPDIGVHVPYNTHLRCRASSAR